VVTFRWRPASILKHPGAGAEDFSGSLVLNADLGDLAARMCAGLDGVRACLVLSPDGLTLGAYPAGGEDLGREVWDRLEQVASPQRGFLDLGEEVWVIARRGPYTAVLVSAVSLRPGLLLDRVEALLRAAEENRAPDDQEPAAPTKPEKRRPRHREARSPEVAEPAKPPKAKAPAKPPAAENGNEPRPRYSPPEALRSAASKVVDVAKLEEPASREDQPPAEVVPPFPDRGDVDRVALAREFGRLVADSEKEE
jgi:hypothetical protein